MSSWWTVKDRLAWWFRPSELVYISWLVRMYSRPPSSAQVKPPASKGMVVLAPLRLAWSSRSQLLEYLTTRTTSALSLSEGFSWPKTTKL